MSLHFFVIKSLECRSSYLSVKQKTSMKKIIITIVSLSSFFISSDIVYAEQGCKKVESQLEYAKNII